MILTTLIEFGTLPFLWGDAQFMIFMTFFGFLMIYTIILSLILNGQLKAFEKLTSVQQEFKISQHQEGFKKERKMIIFNLFIFSGSFFIRFFKNVAFALAFNIMDNSSAKMQELICTKYNKTILVLGVTYFLQTVVPIFALYYIHWKNFSID